MTGLLRRKPTEYHRTCQACGNEWFVPRAIVEEKPPSRLEMASEKMQAAGSLGSKHRQRVDELAERRRRVLDRDRCPSCGSGRFDEKGVR